MHPLLAFIPHGADWIWIALIVVLLFGANKLPQLARGLGKSLGEFKKAKDEFDKELHSATTDAPAPPKLDDKAATTPGSATSTAELTKKI